MITESAQTISTNADLLCVLYALHDSGYWSENDFSKWATKVFMRAEDPGSWLMDFVVVEHSGKIEQIFDKAFYDAQIPHLEWAYTLSAGFLLMRYSNGDLSEKQVRDLIADLTDAHPICGITIEEVVHMCLEDSRLLGLRDEASALLDQVEVNPVSLPILTAAS